MSLCVKLLVNVQNYIPSTTIGVLFGIALTISISYQECHLLQRKFSPRLITSTQPTPLIEDIDTWGDTENALKQIVGLVEAKIHDTSTEIRERASYVNRTIADDLKRRVRILCWIMSHPKNHRTRAEAVKETWGKHCDSFLIMSSSDDPIVQPIELNVTESHDHLWSKTKEAFKYVFKHHYREADWFYKADDDTYANIENMRYFLQSYSTENPIYFGYKFRAHVRQGYFSGGAGYVLSKKALRKFIKEALPDPEKCKADETGAEDAEIGVCLENVHVYAGDTRDALGRGRFFIDEPVYHLRQSQVDQKYWFFKNQFYLSDEGLNCCSDRAISWHWVQPSALYYLDFFMYKLRIHGRMDYANEPLPSKVNFTAVVEALQSTIIKPSIR